MVGLVMTSAVGPRTTVSATQRFGRSWVRSGHHANTRNRSLLTDSVEKVGFRLGLCCWMAF